MLSVDNRSTATLSLFKPNGLREELTPLFNDGYYLEIKCFVDSIIRNEPPPVPGEEGLKSLEVVLAGLKSVFTGKPVKLPLEEEVF